MKHFLQAAAAAGALTLVACCAGNANAASVSQTLSIVIQSSLVMTFTPAAPTIPCNAAAGTVVASFVLSGGDGNTVPTSPTLAGDTTDFAISGTNIVVGPSGIAAANCGRTVSVTVTATQQ
jgi:hypothetical protein